MKDIPAPHVIKQRLDEYVIGPGTGKEGHFAVAVYNHYKRVYAEDLRNSGKNSGGGTGRRAD